MENQLSIENFRKASQGLYFLLIIALLYSFYLITIVNIALLVLGLIHLYYHHKSHKWEWLPISLLALGFLPYLQGLFISGETDRALREIQHNLAYLSIPVAVIWLPKLTYKQKKDIFGFFIIVMVLSTIPVLLKYFMNFEEITKSMGSGQAIPTPIDHVRYSIFIAIACVFSFITYFQKEAIFENFKSRHFLVLGLYLFLIVHLLAVRSGIGLSYIGLAVAGGTLLYKAKKYKILILLFSVMILSPLVAYYAFPSFQNKIKYTRYDYSLLKSGGGANYSDSERIRSYKIGLDIWQDHKLIGIGTGDLKRELNNRYQAAYPDGGRSFLPHNQIIKFLATSGLLGLFLFLISFYAPFIMARNYANPYVLALVAIISVSFMVEATLERSYMLSLYLVFAALLYRSNAEELTS